MQLVCCEGKGFVSSCTCLVNIWSLWNWTRHSQTERPVRVLLFRASTRRSDNSAIYEFGARVKDAERNVLSFWKQVRHAKDGK